MRVRTPIDLGLLIRGRRQALDLDQETLARRVGVSRQWIVGVEGGKPGAPIGLLLRTLQVLGLGLRVDEGGGTEGNPGPGRRGRATTPLLDLDAVIAKAREPKR